MVYRSGHNQRRCGGGEPAGSHGNLGHPTHSNEHFGRPGAVRRNCRYLSVRRCAHASTQSSLDSGCGQWQLAIGLRCEQAQALSSLGPRRYSVVGASMKQLVRPLIATIAGIVLSALLDVYLHRQPVDVSFHFEFVIGFLRVVQPAFGSMVIHLLPWFVTGLIATRRPVLCGAIGSAIAATFASVDLFSLLPPDYLGQLLVSSLALAAIGACYGAAGAALGAIARSAYSSFKPKPQQLAC